jgi:hypothetical protein
VLSQSTVTSCCCCCRRRRCCYGLGPTHLPIPLATGALSLGVKRTGREADHSPPSSAEVKNFVCVCVCVCGELYSTPQYAFMAWCSAKIQEQVSEAKLFSVSIYMGLTRVRGGVAPQIFPLVGNTQGKSSGTRWVGSWVDSRFSMDAAARRKLLCLCQESNPCRPSRSLVSILTDLSLLQ